MPYIHLKYFVTKHKEFGTIPVESKISSDLSKLRVQRVIDNDFANNDDVLEGFVIITEVSNGN